MITKKIVDSKFYCEKMRIYSRFSMAALSVFALILAALSAPVNADSGNLVPNPSVETANPSNTNLPQDWTTDKWGTNTAAFSYLTSGHTGSRSVKVQISKYTSGDAKWYFTSQPVTPGTVYTVSEYYQSNIASRVVIMFTSTSNALSYKELAGAAASPTAWALYSAQVTAPSNAKLMTVFHLISKVGWLITDDYSVTSGSTPPTTGSLTVTKTSVGGDGTFAMTGSGTIGAFSLATAGGTKSQTFANLAPGTYAISETVPAGWTQTSSNCGSVAVSAGQAATCGITNAKLGSLTVTKETTGGNGTFTFAGAGGSFSIATTNGTGSATINNLIPGNYSITEDAPENGWNMTGSTCGSVTVPAGGSAGCTITNAYTTPPTTGSLTVTKTAIGGNGTFAMAGSGSIGNFDLTTDGGAKSRTFDGLAPGSYSVTETVPVDWTQTSSTCGNVTVAAGQTATCNITNTYAPPAGTLVVKKVVINDGGGTKLPQDFFFSVNGAGTVPFEADGQNDLTVQAGTYTITEPASANYTTTAQNCSNVVVQSGQTQVCTVTNTYAPPAGGDNVIPNPSAETGGTLPTSWNKEKWGTNTTTFTYLKTQGHTGTRSLKVQTTKYTSGDAKWYFNALQVTPGDNYMFSDWYKSNIATRVVVYFVFADGSDHYVELRSAPPASSWMQYSDIITVPANASSMTVFHMISAVGWLQTDDYSLVKTNVTGFDKARITFTFDDGWEDNTTTMLPVIDSHGFKVTYFFATTFLENSPATGTPDVSGPAAVRLFYDGGNEVGSHSVTHPDLTTVTPDTLNYELTHSKQYLEGLVGTGNIKSFATPYGTYNDAVLAELVANYESHRPVDEGFNVKNTFDPYRLKVQNMLNTTTSAEYQGWVDQAIEDKSWLIIVYHRIATGDLGDYDTPYADFTSQMDYVKNSGIAVQPLSQALSEIKPQLTY